MLDFSKDYSSLTKKAPLSAGPFSGRGEKGGKRKLFVTFTVKCLSFDNDHIITDKFCFDKVFIKKIV